MSKLKDVLKAIEAISKTKPVDKISLADLEEQDASLTPWELRKLGGLSNIKDVHFPQEDKDLATTRTLSEKHLHIS